MLKKLFNDYLDMWQRPKVVSKVQDAAKTMCTVGTRNVEGNKHDSMIEDVRG